MSNYTKATNFATKDSLPTGNAGKIIKGTEIDTEFNNIATAIATKLNTSDLDAELAGINGRIVQTVVGTAGAAYTTSTSFTTTGLSATITPTSATSKILILAHAMMWQTNAYTSGNGLTALYRNGSNLVGSADWTIVAGQPSYNDIALSHLDSPASTSALTYAIYFKAQNGGDVAFNSSGNAGSIILMEIA